MAVYRSRPPQNVDIRTATVVGLNVRKTGLTFAGCGQKAEGVRPEATSALTTIAGARTMNDLLAVTATNRGLEVKESVMESAEARVSLGGGGFR